MVTAPSAGVADLRVIDMWLEGDVVYYKVANMGAVASTGSTSRLLVENNEKSTDYLEPIAAGKEVTGGFFKYQFQVASGAEGGFGYGDQPMSAAQVKVCVDINDETKESDEFNNCLTKMLGLGFDFDFVKYAHIAIWRNGSGVLKWPMVAGDTRGAAFLSTYTLEDGKSYGNALGTYPQQVAFGSLQGMFGQPETKWLGAEASIKAIELPRNVKFSAKVGFKEGANKSTGATVTFGIVDPSGMMVVLKSVKVLYDGKLDLVEADLGPMAGQKITFVLRVEAGDNWDDDYVIWVEPKLTQGQ
jgi:hypothetical protein